MYNVYIIICMAGILTRSHLFPVVSTLKFVSRKLFSVRTDCFDVVFVLRLFAFFFFFDKLNFKCVLRSFFDGFRAFLKLTDRFS